MSRTGTWSFATTAGRVEVAPDERRVRKRVARTCGTVVLALAGGRLPGVELRGAEDANGVSRTAVDALVTELAA